MQRSTLPAAVRSQNDKGASAERAVPTDTPDWTAWSVPVINGQMAQKRICTYKLIKNHTKTTPCYIRPPMIKMSPQTLQLTVYIHSTNSCKSRSSWKENDSIGSQISVPSLDCE